MSSYLLFGATSVRFEIGPDSSTSVVSVVATDGTTRELDCVRKATITIEVGKPTTATLEFVGSDGKGLLPVSCVEAAS